ncbi:hypothetical protein PN498_24490 [Oscillatoria sp. CS-180]|uniref:hypothetical protein n=1 Tax=Oscillatoria sp. CS-180 TaxID=3021720 RepID=UPI00232BA5C6|nr:hypothetical protein [Oscillatoria sp. CS-180]MDB9529174.1 hypothetical protein [Oscillatoria sp. CS-180]
MTTKFFRQAGLAALFIGLSSAFTAAHAAPDPLFAPVLDEIRAELPEGWQFRLPAEVPSEGEIYPFISSASDTELVVSLGITPDCADPSCTVGMIAATDTEISPEDLAAAENVTPVELNTDIQGYHLLLGEGDTANQLVMWQQDGLTYTVVALANDPPQEQFVDIARSMANEAPISSMADEGPSGPTLDEPSGGPTIDEGPSGPTLDEPPGGPTVDEAPVSP